MIELKEYRDVWLAEKINEFIGICPREFYMLDNYSPFGLKYKNEFYFTVEHAYQASKFFKTAPEIAKQILKAYSPHEAKQIAWANKDKYDPKFDEYKIDLMEELLRLKLEQNPYVKQQLLKTKNYLICEDSTDIFWGIGLNRDGRNEAGKLWMKLRAELKE